MKIKCRFPTSADHSAVILEFGLVVTGPTLDFKTLVADCVLPLDKKQLNVKTNIPTKTTAMLAISPFLLTITVIIVSIPAIGGFYPKYCPL
jgi:hypothetical protein